MKILILVAFVVAVAIIMPFVTIWSLNTLFPVLAIPFNFETWCSILILGGIVSGNPILTFKGNK